MDAPIHVLLVDDEPGIRHVLGALIKDFGYDAHTAESAREALEAFAAHPFPGVLQKQPEKHHVQLCGLHTGGQVHHRGY